MLEFEAQILKICKIRRKSMITIWANARVKLHFQVQNFSVRKNLGYKKYLVQNILGQIKFWVKTNFWPKKKKKEKKEKKEIPA